MSAKSFASFAKNFANFAVKIISYPKNSETQSNKKKSLAPKVVTNTFRTASKEHRAKFINAEFFRQPV
jgi:hypothetical protein